MNKASQPENKPVAVADKNDPPTAASAQALAKSLEMVMGRPRQIMDGALLGTSIVFFAAMLGMPQLDTALTIASAFFAVAIPFLGCGFVFAAFVNPPPPDWPEIKVTLWGSYLIESLGVLAAFVGLFFVMWHISLAAFWGFVAAFLFILISLRVLTFLVQMGTDQDKKQDKTPSGENVTQGDAQQR